MVNAKTKIWYLKNIDIFSHLRDEEYKIIDKDSSLREIRKGEFLYLQGTSDKNVYFVKRGAVKITKLTPNGKIIILDIIKGGTLLGEMGLVETHERDETAEVIEDGLICTMSKDNFDKLLKMVPGLAIRITKMMGLRRWKIENKLLDLLYSTVEQRLARTVLNLLDDFGTPQDGGYLIKIKLTHQDIADLVASTRETVTSTLNHLKTDNIIDIASKYIIVKDIDKLKTVAEG